jgi:antitoxin component of MazEF toxin-antitoxin module
MRYGGIVISGNRITIKKDLVEALNIEKGDLYTAEIHGENEILITLIKPKPRQEGETS